MAENPLLPNARLRALYKTMLQAADLNGKSLGPQLEAVLAGSLLHLEDGDFALPLSQSASLPLLASMGFDTANPQPVSNTLLLAAGAALALKEAGGERLAVVFLRRAAASKSELGWADTLRYATEARLPLLVICVAPEETARKVVGSSVLSLESMNDVAKQLHLPVISIDGEDAVAVYRAMQESVLRARQGGGPAVLWCLFPVARPQGSPLDRLRAYLAARGLGRLAH